MKEKFFTFPLKHLNTLLISKIKAELVKKKKKVTKRRRNPPGKVKIRIDGKKGEFKAELVNAPKEEKKEKPKKEEPKVEEKKEEVVEEKVEEVKEEPKKNRGYYCCYIMCLHFSSNLSYRKMDFFIT